MQPASCTLPASCTPVYYPISASQHRYPLALSAAKLMVNGKRCREVYGQMVERAIHSRFLVGRSLGQNQMPALASVAAFEHKTHVCFETAPMPGSVKVRERLLDAAWPNDSCIIYSIYTVLYNYFASPVPGRFWATGDRKRLKPGLNKKHLRGRPGIRA
jgi:hypothetical protein